jgi:hypothetical protein
VFFIGQRSADPGPDQRIDLRFDCLCIRLANVDVAVGWDIQCADHTIACLADDGRDTVV